VTAEKPRQIAMRVLKRSFEEPKFLDDLLEEELRHLTLKPQDRGLVKELVFGISRWQSALDWLIARKSTLQPKPEVEILLRMGLYQIFWLERIPEHAAVHETVELAKANGFPRQANFINAVLRGFLREREATQKALEVLKADEPAKGYSHPDWLCERWRRRWDGEKLQKLLEWNNSSPPTYARVNTLKTDAAQLAAKWKEEGVEFTPRQWDWVGDGLLFELVSHPSLAALPSFQEGLFYVQDPSTLLAVVSLAPEPGETILDMCAAPGGKTTMIAQLMRNEGSIVAQDPNNTRRDLVRENCQRLGVTNVQMVHPGVNPRQEKPFDRILVDAPCSNTGVMRRRIDVRWRLRGEEIDRLRETQSYLLRQGARQLRPGGRLVYSTCSIEPEENGDVVKEFLEGHRNFVMDYERSLLPFIDGVDGAYVARLRKL
jgi:16S rRNA (cytosine967-C5)-methyltransferase